MKPILDLIVVGGLIVIVRATVNHGTTAAPPAPITRKIMRRKDKSKQPGSAAEIAMLLRKARDKEQRERKLDYKIPPHVPIKIRLKADKEAKFKDLDNPDWIRDFDLEVTNKSDKPIYFLELWVVYSGVFSNNGSRVGAPLRYGRMDFVNLDTRALPSDVPILPGETISFTIPEQYRLGWSARKLRENRPDPKQLEITFVQLSYGDGSGFNGTDAKPYPYHRSQARNLPQCLEPPERQTLGYET